MIGWHFFTDKQAFNSAILHGLEQLVQQPTFIPDHLCINSLFLYWAPSITILSNFSVLPLMCLLLTWWRGAVSAITILLRRYHCDFPWNDCYFRVWDPCLSTEHISQVIVSGMETYFLSSQSSYTLVELGLLSKTERQLMDVTLVFRFLKLIFFLSETIRNLPYNLL